jgi:hypothetical protein
MFFTARANASQEIALVWPISGQAAAVCKRFLSHDSKEKRVFTRQDKTQLS